MNNRMMTKKYKMKNEPDGTEKIGVVAQELLESFPYCVSKVFQKGDDEGTFLVDYHQITSLHIGAIKRLTERIEVLEAEIKKLKKM